MLRAVCWAVVLLASVLAADNHQHMARDTHKAQVGWQEPGLWRPKWIMERTFFPSEGADGRAVKERRDRVPLRLRNDRTVKLYTSRHRPLVELMKRKGPVKRSARKLFETEDDVGDVSSSPEEELETKTDSDDGTWWWRDLAPVKQGHVKVELKDEQGGAFFSHEAFCDWGKLDPYVAKFRRGKILRYRRNEAGLPGKMEEVGSFVMRVSLHRPLVSKEFLAFQ